MLLCAFKLVHTDNIISYTYTYTIYICIVISTRLLYSEYYIIIISCHGPYPLFYVIIYPTPNDHYDTVLFQSRCVFYLRGRVKYESFVLSINQIKMQNDEEKIIYL